MNQAELTATIDPFLITPAGEIEHLHNQLIAGIYANVTREMPDSGVASWVSANDKATTGVGSKPVSGDAAEQRLKTEVMQLPSRDRRRLKDLSQNDVGLHITLRRLHANIEPSLIPRILLHQYGVNVVCQSSQRFQKLCLQVEVCPTKVSSLC